MTLLEGMCVPICTPFDASGERLDEVGLLSHVDHMVESGVHIIMTCGGTGEFAYLRPEERRLVHEKVARHLNGQRPMVMHTSAINTMDAIDLAKHAQGIGASAVMVLPPYFEGPDTDGVISFYESLAAAVDVPIMVYNIPVHSGIDITPALFTRLLEIDNIEYIKDSTGDMIRIQELVATGGRIFNGADPLAFFGLLAGCEGCVWGAVNAMPTHAVALFNHVRHNELDAARELWKRMLPSQLFFWSHVYNAAVKAAVGMRSRHIGPCRSPVQPLSDEVLAELAKALAPLSEPAD